MRCTVCNWSSHDVSVHGETCQRGHPIAIVGRTSGNRCRRCHADRERERAARNRDRERERCRRYHWAHREKVIERKRRKRGSGHADAQHPWRLDSGGFR